MHIDGARQCGGITYQGEVDPERVWICRCTDCQRLTAAAYRVSVITESDKFRILSGEPKLYVKTADNGRRRLQFFCPDCVSNLHNRRGRGC